MKKRFLFRICLLVLLYNTNVFAQGCSDAGFCSLSAMRDHYLDSLKNSKKYQVGLGVALGKSDFNILVFNSQVEASAKLNSQFTLGVKATYASISGELAKVNNFSDVFVTSNINLPANFSFTLGLKIPLNKGNERSNGYSLPMYYQTSLGTTDLIFGINKQYKNWLFSVGAQIPMNQNGNAFDPKQFSTVNALALNYVSTNKFERMSDVLLRASYSFNFFDSKVEFTPGILPIYHLANDAYTDAFGFQKSIDGSAGLTLNLTSALKYHVTDFSFFELNFGAPAIARKARPDGLTRKFALSLEYKLRF